MVTIKNTYGRKRTPESKFRTLQKHFSDPTKASGLMLASFLNHAETKERDDLLRLLSACREVLKYAGPLLEWEVDQDGVGVLQESDSPLWPKIREINRELKRYDPAPLQFHLPTLDKPQLRLAIEHDSGKNAAAYRVVQLTLSNNLDPLRQCEACKAWYYAFKADQKWCGGKCLRKNYESATTVKKQKALYKKVEYWREKKNAIRAELEKPFLTKDQKTGLSKQLRAAKEKEEEFIEQREKLIAKRTKKGK